MKRSRWNKLDMSSYSSINLATGESLALSLKHQKPFYFSKLVFPHLLMSGRVADVQCVQGEVVQPAFLRCIAILIVRWSTNWLVSSQEREVRLTGRIPALDSHFLTVFSTFPHPSPSARLPGWPALAFSLPFLDVKTFLTSLSLLYSQTN